jgi:hypothetical protein
MTATKLTPLAGKSVPGLETYPTLNHLDFDQEQFAAFLADPVAVGRQLGLDMNKASIHLEHWDEEWDGREHAWKKRARAGDPKPRGMNRVICINTGSVVYCWHIVLK